MTQFKLVAALLATFALTNAISLETQTQTTQRSSIDPAVFKKCGGPMVCPCELANLCIDDACGGDWFPNS